MGKAGLPHHITGCSRTQHLFKFFFPAGAGDPFFVGLVIEAVAFGLSQEIVQIVQKIGIALIDGPGQRFKGERVAQKYGFALALASPKEPAVGQIIHQCIGLAVDDLEAGFGFGFKSLVGGLGDILFNGLLTGGAHPGGDDVFGVIKIFVRQYFVFELFA